MVTRAVPAETLWQTFDAPAHRVEEAGGGQQVFEMPGYRLRGGPGNPLLPQKVFHVLLPPDVVWDSVVLRVVERKTRLLKGPYRMQPGLPDVADVRGGTVTAWGEGRIVAGQNMDVYGEDAFFPATHVRMMPRSQLRKWRFVRIRFSPFRVNPVTGEALLASAVRLRIDYERTGRAGADSLLGDTVMDDLAPDMFDNYDEAAAWYTTTSASDKPGPAYDYVIVTSDAIVSGSGKLADFVSHKESRGFSVLVVTESDYGSLTGQAPNHRAEKIRQWLIDHYATYGITYVLLIGDPSPYESGEGDVPMKMCWPRSGAGSDEKAPTDAFFADLTGDWDKDGDQLFGEMDDYTASGGVDFSMEVWVGRIPVYGSDMATLDAILQKTMDYENEVSPSWRESVLLPMSFSSSSYDGAPLAEQMRDDYLVARGFDSWRMYQQGNSACGPDSPYTSEEELQGGTIVQTRWAATDRGVVCWMGHGSATSTSVGYDGCWDGTLFNASQTSALDDGHPSFTFQCSCLNGYPENSGNLQYAILKQGGIGTVSSSRVSWYNTGVGYGDFDGSSVNGGIGYEFVERLTDYLKAGRALYEGKLAVVPDIGGRNTRLMNQYDFNLYGDPAVALDSQSAGTRSLTVSSACGMADPPAGVHTLPAGTNLACAVTNSPVIIVDEQRRMTCVCTGWQGTGSAPAAGEGTNTGSFSLTLDSSVTWQWAVSDLVLSNQTVVGSLNTQALNTVTARDGFEVGASGDAHLRAGETVRLAPGFRAVSGSVFRATVEDD